MDLFFADHSGTTTQCKFLFLEIIEKRLTKEKMYNGGGKQRGKISLYNDYISLCGIDPNMLTGFQHLERIIT